ncbi:MAG: hypothetical protein Q7S06_01990 [Nanoarchaeota archaeon]|nr:hypothetical protein [Nanoarchaeota archaeon]
MVKNKSAQMKIQQMAFMLMAITLFFVLVGIFVLVIRFSGLKEDSQTLEQENAMLLVSKLANSGEFSCENAFGTLSNCIDADKVIALSSREEYERFFGVAKIEIRKIYPDNGNTLCNEENYQTCGVIRVLDRNVKTLPSSSNFVSLCRREIDSTGIGYDKCEMAKLIVTGEDKT